MKILKLLTMVALVCHGQSVLAMNLGPQAHIKLQVDAMNDDAIVTELQTRHLNGITLQEEDGDYRIYENNGQFLCFPQTYLTIIRQLEALRDNNMNLFYELVNFVQNNPQNPIPFNLIAAVLDAYYAMQPTYRHLATRIIRNIIQNQNILWAPSYP